MKGERRDKRKHKFSGFVASLPYFTTYMPALAPVTVRPQPNEPPPILSKNSERRAQRQTKTQVFRVYRKFAIFYHLYAGACASCGSAAADRKNACIIKTTTTIRNIRTRFLHGRNGYRVNINNVKQKATVMLQNALPKRNFLPSPGERKKYV